MLFKKINQMGDFWIILGDNSGFEPENCRATLIFKKAIGERQNKQ